MSLIHVYGQITDATSALACHRCKREYTPDEYPSLVVGCSDELRCVDCEVGGMIPRSSRTIVNRLGPSLAQRFTPLPEALMDHAATLDLGPHELVVIWALERHRRRRGDTVHPSRSRLRDLTRLSEGQLKRAMNRLVKAERVLRDQPHLRAVNRYDTEPLLALLEELESVGRQ